MQQHATLKEIPLGRIMGIDYGEKRIGIAMSDPMQRLSSAVCTVDNIGPKKSANKIVEIAQEHAVITIVTGLPLNMDGTRGEKADLVEQFVVRIQNRLPKTPVMLWDERRTTKSAEDILHQAGKSPSKNRHLIDQIAAEIILQSFLDRLDYIKRVEKG